MQKRKIKNSIMWDCLSILNPLRNKLLMCKKRRKNELNFSLKVILSFIWVVSLK